MPVDDGRVEHGQEAAHDAKRVQLVPRIDENDRNRPLIQVCKALYFKIPLY